MSRIAFIGRVEVSWRIFQSLSNYEALSNREISILEWIKQMDSSYDASISSHQLLVENKYYTAQLSAHLFPSTWYPRDEDEFEAIIIIQDDMTVGSDQFENIGKYASDRNLALCLRIFYQDDVSCLTETAREDAVLWSIDHGFEFIEVYNSSLLQDVNARDKNGLPRMMEALQSVMWSSMMKLSKPKIVAESPDSSVQLPPRQSSEKESGTVLAQTTVEESNYIPLGNGETVDSADNEDEKLLDTFASALEHAQSIRDQALRGEISDEQRRSNAATLAMKLMEMMGIDEESEED